MDRLKMLEKMAGDRPDDPFPSYGLAMEYRKLGRQAEARKVFERLMRDHPEYVATYLMAGNLLAELGEQGLAVEAYERGMTVADDKGDDHTLGELRAARAELP